MNPEILFSTEPTSTYNIVKYLLIGIGMWIVACGTSACGVKVGESVIGTPSFAQTVYKGELELEKQRGVK